MINLPLVAYGCGSPIRLPIVEAFSGGAKVDKFIPHADPEYIEGNSIVWGLIRGASHIISKTIGAGCSFYQMDNAYFGRDQLFRITKNQLQLSRMRDVNESRLDQQFKDLGLKFESWKKKRGEQILLCTSSEDLYSFFNTTKDEWINSTVETIRRFSDRPISLRSKQLVGIEDAVRDAWIVVTHSSAAAIDALRLGYPVIVTADSAASPLATSFNDIERPRITANRRRLFATLAWGQFSLSEMESGFAWSVVSGNI